MREIVIEVKDVMKQFPTGAFLHKKIKVLDEITFELEEGENLAIVGPNGSGKTTLLKILATIYLPDKGSVKIYDHDIFKDISKVRDMISFVSPALSFQKKLTLRETLKFFSGIQDSNIEDIYPFLEEIGLDQLMDERLEGFSEGQKAMTRLAIGMLKHPKILLLDEVTATLDVRRKEEVIDYIDKLDNKLDLTLGLIDHDPMVVDRLCHKILLLRRGGTILRFANVSDLFHEIPYRYDVKVYPRKPLKTKVLDSFGFPYEKLGDFVRFLTKSKKEVDEIHDKLF